MTLETAEFIPRFLIHVLPKGFHRIRHYGLFASGTRADNLSLMRTLLAMAMPLPNATHAGKADASRQRRRSGAAPVAEAVCWLLRASRDAIRFRDRRLVR